MELQNFSEVYPAMYLFDLFRYLIPASVAFLIFWIWGRKAFRHLLIQNKFPENRHLVREFLFSMSTVVIFSIVGFFTYSAEKSGITKIYYEVSEYGVVYLLFSFALTLVFHDFYFYWTHRLMHHKRIFKYVHRVHHESTNPSPWAAYAFHPWEALLQALVMPIMVFLFPLHPTVIFLFLIYMIVRNVIGHLGFEVFPKGWTKNRWLSWTTAVTHHNIHHERFHSNYGLYFTWWDRWMKTEDLKYHEDFDEVKSRPKVNEGKSAISSVTTLVLLVASTASLNAQSVVGKWTTYNEETGSRLSTIEIVKTKGSIAGKVSEIFLEPYQGDDPTCTKCSGERKDKKVINMNFLWGFKRDGKEWTEGKILDPQNGETYSSKLWLEDNNTMKVRGYGGVMDLFYRTQTWKRIGNSPTDSPAGMWSTIDDTWNQAKSEVELVERNGELLGYVRKIFLLPNEGKDPVCTACDGELKNTRIVGMVILNDFQENKGKWEAGKILDPGNGKVYTASIWLISNNELRVRGYLGPFYRTQTWKRDESDTSLLDD